MLLTVSLSTAAALALLTVWLMIRTGQVRAREKIAHGDGGNPALIRRMRAQLNFVESAPFVMALILVIELSGRGAPWLAYVAGAYVLGRVAHALGMDAEAVSRLRMIGVATTMLTLIGLIVMAVLIMLRVI